MMGSALRALTGTWSGKTALFVAVCAGLGLCAMPLFGIPGAESALVLGVLLPPFVAAAVSRAVIGARGDGRTAEKWLDHTFVMALLVVALPAVILSLDGLRIRNCSPAEGLAFLILGPGMGAWLAAWAALLVTLAIPRAAVAQTCAVLVPVVTELVGAYHLYDTPAVFAYNHFAGYLPGTLYDELISLSGTYASFRVETLAVLGALGFGTAAFFDPASGRLRLSRLSQAPVAAAAAVGCALFAALIFARGEHLGHRTSTAYITEKLGAAARGPRCTVVLPRELDMPSRARLLEDCEFRLFQAEATLGVKSQKRVTAFIFRSAAEKKRLMGAGATYVAKPWRREVYLQVSGFPHPVLFHELSHVVAGEVASGPFKVAGRLHGLWPAPGLIEGLAVAVAWDARDGLTPHQWARAMLDLGLMPPMRRLLGLGFLAGSSSRAYVAAGSFLRFLLDTRGKAVVDEAYRTGDLEMATGTSLGKLEEDWHDFLRTVPLSDGALGLARVRFEPAGIFSSVCPHRVAALAQELSADMAAEDHHHALQTCKAILAIDPHDPDTKAAYVESLARGGDMRGAEKALAELAAPPVAPAPILAAAREAVADEAWRRGDTHTAASLYRTILSAPLSDDAARPLEVKLAALTAGGEQAKLVFDILVGDGAGASAPQVVVERAERLRALRTDGLGAYLLARQLVNGARPDLALPWLDEALEKTLPSERLTKEASRLRMTALYLDGRLTEAALAASQQTETPGEQVTAADWLARIAWKKAH